MRGRRTFETIQEAERACSPKQRVEVLDDGDIILMPKTSRKKAISKPKRRPKGKKTKLRGTPRR